MLMWKLNNIRSFYVFMISWEAVLHILPYMASDNPELHSIHWIKWRGWIHWYHLLAQWHNSQIHVGFDPQCSPCHQTWLLHNRPRWQNKKRETWKIFTLFFNQVNDGRGYWRDGGGLLYDWPCEVSSFHLLSKACWSITATQCCILFLKWLFNHLSKLFA